MLFDCERQGSTCFVHKVLLYRKHVLREKILITFIHTAKQAYL